MDLFDCIKQRTSIRRFSQKPVDINDLEHIIEGIRIGPSAANLQTLSFIITNKKQICEKIFPHIGWAAYLNPPWSPEENERPPAYISILNNLKDNVYVDFDVGISMAYIVLGAQYHGLGSCILCKINKQKIKKILNIPKELDLKAVIAIGQKNEKVYREENSSSVKYWRDDQGIFHVPKKPLSTILHKQYYTSI